MNKHQEALNFLDWHCQVPHQEQQYLLQELIDIYPEYLELKSKETPMKPIKNYDKDYTCKKCNEGIYPKGEKKIWYRIFHPYHSTCGQRIDWSNEDE